MRLLAIACLLAACGGSAPPASKPKPTLVDPVAGPEVDCATAIDHVLTTMTPGGVPVQAMSDLDLQRCKEDAWSAEARSCMATAMSNEQGQSCFDNELTNEQRKQLGEATLAAFGDK